MKHCQKKGGFVLLAAVLSLLVFSSALLFSFTQFFLGNMAIVETVRSGRQALALAEGCAEAVLDELRNDASFSDDLLELPTGECALDIEQNGNQYQIHIEARYETTVKKILIECIRGENTLSVTAWLEE